MYQVSYVCPNVKLYFITVPHYCGTLRLRRIFGLPSKQELRWLQTRKLLAYRESTCPNLSIAHPYEIIVYSVLKHIKTDKMHTNCRQFIPLIYRTLGKSLDSNLFCPFTSVKSCPVVILPVLILTKYTRVYSFMTIQYL